MRNIKYLVTILALLLTTPLPAKKGHGGGSVNVVGLRVENMTNPLGIDTDKPRFSWITGDHYQNKDVRQTA